MDITIAPLRDGGVPACFGLEAATALHVSGAESVMATVLQTMTLAAMQVAGSGCMAATRLA
jgi:hypothetical protein